MHQRTQAMIEDDARGRSWRDGLLDRIEWDLANSREMMTSTKELRLRGFCGRDPVVRESTHRLVEVAYELRDVDGQSCLVRTERLLDSGAAGLHNVELMGVGITGLILLGREEGEDRGGLETVDIVPTSEGRLLGGKPGATRTWLPVPRVCRLSLLGTNRHSVADRLIVF